jgi:uncharacterized protein YehS (DUF1456 family)
MLNNDILRRVRYIKDYNDQEMIQIFEYSELAVSRQRLNEWLRKDDHPEYIHMEDIELSSFLTGLIIKLRGKREDQKPSPESSLTNNIVLRKLMIAFSLKSEEVIDILKLAEFKLGQHELSAFFRKPGHKNYRECKAQVLRNFLAGLQLKLR